MPTECRVRTDGEPYGCRRNLGERGIDSCDEANPATRIVLLVVAKVRGELARRCWSETDHFNRSRLMGRRTREVLENAGGDDWIGDEREHA